MHTHQTCDGGIATEKDSGLGTDLINGGREEGQSFLSRANLRKAFGLILLSTNEIFLLYGLVSFLGKPHGSLGGACSGGLLPLARRTIGKSGKSCLFQ